MFSSSILFIVFEEHKVNIGESQDPSQTISRYILPSRQMFLSRYVYVNFEIFTSYENISLCLKKIKEDSESLGTILNLFLLKF